MALAKMGKMARTRSAVVALVSLLGSICASSLPAPSAPKGRAECGLKEESRTLEIVVAEPDHWIELQSRIGREREAVQAKEGELRKFRKSTGGWKKLWHRSEYKAEKRRKLEEIQRLESEHRRGRQEEAARQLGQVLLVDTEKLGNGGFASVYAGQLREESCRERCVVVRQQNGSHGQPSGEFFNGARILHKLQTEVPADRRRHIIEMLSFGKRQSGGAWVMVLEKGEGDLRERRMVPQSEHSVLKDEQEFAEIARQVVWPLRELHQEAMHLDFKPENLVYVPGGEGQGQQLLKLIDFDGAQWMRDDENGCEEADCAKKARFAHVGSKRYRSPEQDRGEKMVSRKADIWPVGVILYELILLRNTKMPKSAMEVRLQHMLELFRGYRLNKSESIETLPMEELEWVWMAFGPTIKTILAARAEVPLISRLITNALNVDPTKRMSAAGILDYLDGKCLPAEFRSASNADEVPLFGGIALGKLMAHLPGAVRKLEAASKQSIDGRIIRMEDVDAGVYSAIDQASLPILRGKGTWVGKSHVDEVLNALKEVQHDEQLLHKIVEGENGIIAKLGGKPECDTKTTKL